MARLAARPSISGIWTSNKDDVVDTLVEPLQRLVSLANDVGLV